MKSWGTPRILCVLRLTPHSVNLVKEIHHHGHHGPAARRGLHPCGLPSSTLPLSSPSSTSPLIIIRLLVLLRLVFRLLVFLSFIIDVALACILIVLVGWWLWAWLLLTFKPFPCANVGVIKEDSEAFLSFW